MVTRNDFLDIIALNNSNASKEIDKWLKSILPKFRNDGQGFDVRELLKICKITLKQLKVILESRGFGANTYSDYQGSFVYLYVGHCNEKDVYSNS